MNDDSFFADIVVDDGTVLTKEANPKPRRAPERQLHLVASALVAGAMALSITVLPARAPLSVGETRTRFSVVDTRASTKRPRGVPRVEMSPHHRTAAARLQLFARPVPLSAAEKLPDPDYGF